MARNGVIWFILLAPALILLGDWLIYKVDGYDATITAVTRGWADESLIPEVIYVVATLLLWAHIFRRWI